MLTFADEQPTQSDTMNQIPFEKRVAIIRMLVEGMSMRATSRTVGVSINAVMRTLVAAGKACADFHDENVRCVHARRIECDEIWAFCYAKQKNVAKAKAAPGWGGDIWAWTAVDADSRLIISFTAGDRSIETASPFMRDLRRRVIGRPQINTDGHPSYLEAIDEAFGLEIDYAQLIKVYGKAPKDEDKRYSPPQCIEISKHRVLGNPDMDEVSTSYVERQNLSMRMGMRRYTRLTNAFSKKLENHFHMLSIYFVYYNFVRDPHRPCDALPRWKPGLQMNCTTISSGW